MNKKVLAAAMAATFAMSAGVALADPVELSGKVVVENREVEKTAGNGNGVKESFILNAKTNVAENLDVYARFGMQHAANGFAGPDFNTSVHTGNNAAAIDQYGLIYKNAGTSYKLGRQDVFIGTGLFFDNTYYVGKKVFADGISVDTKIGDASVNVVAAQLDQNRKDDDKIYSVYANMPLAKDLKAGLTLAKYDYADSTKDTNHWAIDTAYTMGKLGLSGEYGKSDADANNEAYTMTASYKLDDSNSFSVTNFKVDSQADMAQNTTWWSGQKGYWYSYSHKLAQDTKLALNYQDSKSTDGTTYTKSFRTQVTYSF